jgi:hypothetical protein
MLPAVRVLVFLHGTAIMHPTAVGRPRAERVHQSRQRDRAVLDFAAYVPTEAAVEKVRTWQRYGAVICYLRHYPCGTPVTSDSAASRAKASRDNRQAKDCDQRAEDRPQGRSRHRAAPDVAESLQGEDQPRDCDQRAEPDQQTSPHDGTSRLLSTSMPPSWQPAPAVAGPTLMAEGTGQASTLSCRGASFGGNMPMVVLAPLTS